MKSPTLRPRPGSDCPKASQHTPNPSGYIDWCNWADEMSKTHKQIRCDGCGLWSIWVKRTKRGKRE